MKIKKLIEKLQDHVKEHGNPDAEVIITIGDEENDTLSTSDFEVFGGDILEYIEIFISETTCARQI